jgi:hypothetical protein
MGLFAFGVFFEWVGMGILAPGGGFSHPGVEPGPDADICS